MTRFKMEALRTRGRRFFHEKPRLEGGILPEFDQKRAASTIGLCKSLSKNVDC